MWSQQDFEVVHRHIHGLLLPGNAWPSLYSLHCAYRIFILLLQIQVRLSDFLEIYITTTKLPSDTSRLLATWNSQRLLAPGFTPA